MHLASIRRCKASRLWISRNEGIVRWIKLYTINERCAFYVSGVLWLLGHEMDVSDHRQWMVSTIYFNLMARLPKRITLIRPSPVTI